MGCRFEISDVELKQCRRTSLPFGTRIFKEHDSNNGKFYRLYYKSRPSLQCKHGLAAIIGVLGLLYVHKRNRDVALQAIKVDLLDIIDGLAKDKAWLFPTRHFSIARAFSLYYGKAIPFIVIRILCQSEDADAAFTSYCKVSGLVNVKG